jgi:hypothetical protein
MKVRRLERAKEDIAVAPEEFVAGYLSSTARLSPCILSLVGAAEIAVSREHC